MRKSAVQRPQGTKCYLSVKRLICLFLKVGDFPGGVMNNGPPASAGDMCLIPGLGRFHMPWAVKVQGPQLLSP